MNTTFTKKTAFHIIVAMLAVLITMSIISAEPVFAGKYDFEKKNLAVNGVDDESIVFVILGDGFTKNDQKLFFKKARELMEYITSTSPFDELKDRMNFYAVGVVSEEAGARNSLTCSKKTYFGSCYNSAYNIDRLLAPQECQKAYAVADYYVPDYDKVLLLVNDTRYGGSGGEIATASINSESYEIMLHEMGHSIGLLADEYWVGDEYADEYPNMCSSNDPDTVPWGDLIDGNEIGIYPYPESPKWYHPSLNCKMQYLGKTHPFCKVCSREIKEQLEEYLWKTNKIQTAYNLVSQLKIRGVKSTLKVGTQISSGKFLSVQRPSQFKLVDKFTDKKFNAGSIEVKLSLKSKNNLIATVSKSGNIIAKKAGSTTIVVKAELADGTSKEYRIRLRVKK